MKKGFGLLEVLVAALVLGFLVVGLNRMQLGNREAVLRVRARDAANFVAQQVLDSLGAEGINSIVANEQSACNDKVLVYCDTAYKYNFKGKGGIDTDIKYKVEVVLLANSEQTLADTTEYIKANGYIDNTTTYAKSLEATVSWKFKQSDQSITIAKVVR